MRWAVRILVGVMAVLWAQPGFSSDSIEIAAIYALTGEAAAVNASSVQGVRSAVEEINQEGGILGRRVELIVYDNRSTPIGSHLAALKATESGSTTAIIGASWSSHSLPIAAVAQSRSVPMISNYSTSPEVTRIGSYIFRVCFTDDLQGAALARFAREDLQAETAVVFVNLNSEYSIGLSQVFSNSFERLGGRVVFSAEYKHKQSQFDEIVARVKAARADILFLSGYDESGSIARMLQDEGVESTPLGGDGWVEASFFARGGDKLKRGYYCSHWSDSMISERSRSFVSKYERSPGYGVGMALAYDAVMLLRDAITRAGSTNRAAIRSSLARTRSFQGVTGTISFDENGDPVKSVVIMEIADGKPRYLKTLNP